MTGLEQILGGVVIAYTGGMGISWIRNRNKVTKDMCKLTHDSLHELLDEKFLNLERRLVEAINGAQKPQ